MPSFETDANPFAASHQVDRYSPLRGLIRISEQRRKFLDEALGRFTTIYDQSKTVPAGESRDDLLVELGTMKGLIEDEQAELDKFDHQLSDELDASVQEAHNQYLTACSLYQANMGVWLTQRQQSIVDGTLFTQKMPEPPVPPVVPNELLKAVKGLTADPNTLNIDLTRTRTSTSTKST